MSSISYILGPEDEHEGSGYSSQDHDSQSSTHNTATLAYRHPRPSAGTSAGNSPGSASGSRSDSRHSSSRPHSNSRHRLATLPAETAATDDYAPYDTTSQHYTMDPHSAYDSNQDYHHYYTPSQHGHAANRGGRGHMDGRDGLYGMEAGGVAGFDPTTGAPIMHPGATVFDGTYDSAAYGTVPGMDTSGVMQHRAEYAGEDDGDVASYSEYQETAEVTPKTGRPSRAKKGRPVHDCTICGKVLTRAEHLRRHLLSHKPFKFFCEVPGCGRTFSREDLLHRHQQKHQSDDQSQSEAGGGGPGPSGSQGPSGQMGQMDQPVQSSWTSAGAVGSTPYFQLTLSTRARPVSISNNDDFYSSINIAASTEPDPAGKADRQWEANAEVKMSAAQGHAGPGGPVGPERAERVERAERAERDRDEPFQQRHRKSGAGRVGRERSSKPSTSSSNNNNNNNNSNWPVRPRYGTVPRTPQDVGIVPGHHCGINMGHAGTYVYHYGHDGSAAPHAAIHVSEAVPPTPIGHHHHHQDHRSLPSPSICWLPPDSTLDSMAYTVPAEGGAVGGSSCVSPLARTFTSLTSWSSGPSATVVDQAHGLPTANSDLLMHRLNSGSWTTQSSPSSG